MPIFVSVTPTPPATVFVSVMPPAFPPMLLLLCKVTGPVKVEVAAPVLVSTPLPPTPLPLRFSGEAKVGLKPARSSVATPVTVTAEEEPSAPLLPSFSVPVCTFVAPV